MKLIFTCFLFILNIFSFTTSLKISNEITPAETAAAYYDEFINNSKDIYDNYYEFTNIKTDKYVYSVVLGIYQGNKYFDVFLYEYDSINHAVRVNIGSDEYNVKSIDDRYYSAHGIQFIGKEETKVYMFNGSSKKNANILPTDFSNLAFENGNGNGPVLTYLDPISPASKGLITIILVSLIVIFGAICGIGILYVCKVGKFKVPVKKRAEVSDDVIEIGVVTDSDPVITNAEEISSVYPNQNPYQNSHAENNNSDSVEENEDEVKEVDIEALLLLKGYKTDYNLMSEEEKNECMVYFMILRRTGQISSEQYQKEVVKLWKK